MIQHNTDGVNYTQIGTLAATATSCTPIPLLTGDGLTPIASRRRMPGGNSSWSGTTRPSHHADRGDRRGNLAAVAMSPTLVARRGRTRRRASKQGFASRAQHGWGRATADRHDGAGASPLTAAVLPPLQKRDLYLRIVRIRQPAEFDL